MRSGFLSLCHNTIMNAILVEPEIYTEADLEELSANGEHYELIRGELKPMSPAGGGHGSVTMDLIAIVHSHIRTNDLGRGFTSETGFVVEENPRTILAPDYAFITRARVPDPMPDNFVPVVPDLVLETRRPGDTARRRRQSRVMARRGRARSVGA